MANDPKGEKAGGAPALDDVKTERQAEAVVRAREAGAAGDGAPVPPAASGDSPKPHGDKLENAVRKAADTPGKGKA
jgi:hypothetical protein